VLSPRRDESNIGPKVRKTTRPTATAQRSNTEAVSDQAPPRSTEVEQKIVRVVVAHRRSAGRCGGDVGGDDGPVDLDVVRRRSVNQMRASSAGKSTLAAATRALWAPTAADLRACAAERFADLAQVLASFSTTTTPASAPGH
jgi:hypothetical protein